MKKIVSLLLVLTTVGMLALSGCGAAPVATQNDDVNIVLAAEPETIFCTIDGVNYTEKQYDAWMAARVADDIANGRYVYSYDITAMSDYGYEDIIELPDGSYDYATNYINMYKFPDGTVVPEEDLYTSPYFSSSTKWEDFEYVEMTEVNGKYVYLWELIQ